MIANTRRELSNAAIQQAFKGFGAVRAIRDGMNWQRRKRDPCKIDCKIQRKPDNQETQLKGPRSFKAAT